MTYNEAVKKINSLLVFGSRPGLERINELVERIGSPDKKLKFVHIAGTNGKGSVCAMLSSVLRQAGYKTGLFISPFVLEFRERFQINGEMIPENRLADIIEKIFPIVMQMKDEGKVITEFELVFAAALEWFADECCDVVVLETGLGGRFDATNIIGTPLASVIMSISLDHTAILGDTCEKIAFEKCGIIKPDGITIAYGEQPRGVIDVIKKAADEKNNRLIVASPDTARKTSSSIDGTEFVFSSAIFNSGKDIKLKISLLGEHQLKNASAALHTIAALRTRGLDIPDKAVKDGLEKTFFPARMEVLRKEPVVMIDGAHNPGGTSALYNALRVIMPEKKKIGIVGMLADKDVKGALSILVHEFDRIITVTPNNPRAMMSDELASIINFLGVPAEVCTGYDTAFDKALAYADAVDGAVIVFGSLYLASDMRAVILDELERI